MADGVMTDGVMSDRVMTDWVSHYASYHTVA